MECHCKNNRVTVNFYGYISGASGYIDILTIPSKYANKGELVILSPVYTGSWNAYIAISVKNGKLKFLNSIGDGYYFGFNVTYDI